MINLTRYSIIWILLKTDHPAFGRPLFRGPVPIKRSVSGAINNVGGAILKYVNAGSTGVERADEIYDGSTPRLTLERRRSAVIGIVDAHGSICIGPCGLFSQINFRKKT